MSASDTTPTLDDETTAALTLFNEYVEADRERTQREKRIKKAERAKDEAAATVKKLNERGSAAQKSEAEAAYREAADRWKKLRDGEEPDEVAPAEEAVAEEPPAEPAGDTTDAAVAEETEPAEPEAAPVEEAKTEEAAPVEEAKTEEPPTEAGSDQEE